MIRILYLTGLAIACLFYSCSKSKAPSPGDDGTGKGSQTALAITDFSPKSAKPGAQITITGTGFGNDISALVVMVGNTQYDKIISVTSTTIVIQTGLATPSGKIKITLNDKSATSSDNFTALPPDLKVVGYDKSGQLGSNIGISGDGFGTDINKIGISFGGTAPVKPSYISPNGSPLTVYVPRYAQEGKITITYNGQSSTGDVNFTLLMSMRDFSPKQFSSGDTVKVTGVKFTNTSDMSVNFNTTTHDAIKPFKVTENEMFVIVPFNATSGTLQITSAGGSLTDYSPDQYTFIPTVYFSNAFTPKSGKVGDLIRINGDFVGADISTLGVSFGGSAFVKPTSITGPDIYVKVPGDAKTGKITISRTGYKSFTAPFTFTITP